MILLYPNNLYLFLGLPVLLFILVSQYFWNYRIFKIFGAGTVDFKIHSAFFLKYFLSAICMVIVYCMFVLSLSGLSWGETPVEEDKSGLDIVYLIDVSYSMLAEDLAPSRLGRVKDLLEVLSFPPSRVGIVAFKGSATVLLPLTEDKNAFNNVVNYLNTEVISSPGSNLEQGLEAAISLFPSVSNSHRIIVLFTDGETLSDNNITSAQKAAELGILIFSYGVGTIEGSVIPLSDGVLTQNGTPVITRLNSRVLRNLANLTRGEYFEEATALELTQTITNRVEQRESKGIRLSIVLRYRVFLVVAFITYVAQLLIRVVKIKGVF